MQIKEKDLEITLPYILRTLGQRYRFQVLQPAMKMEEQQIFLKGVVEYGRMKFAFDTCLETGIEANCPYIKIVQGQVDGPWLKGELYDLLKKYLGHLRYLKWHDSKLYLLDWNQRLRELSIQNGLLTIEFF